MEEIEVDVVVVGSGPAGQNRRSRQRSWGVGCCRRKIPCSCGNCLYSGTIPSKTLREAILDFTGFYERQEWNSEQIIHPCVDPRAQ